MNRGLVHIYTGDGKGKTTASLGLAIRCAGYGRKVLIYQFLKAMPTGELYSCEKLGIDVIRVTSSEKFWSNMNDDEKSVTKAEIIEATEHIYDRKCDLLILDEIICATDLGIISIEKLIDLVQNKPDEVELVLTGRNMPDEIREYADYISEIKCISHPYDNGTDARESIDF